MICLQGKAVCGGMVSGTAYVFRRKAENCTEHKPSGASDELNHLKLAVSSVKENLTLRSKQAENDTAKEIFEVHSMMLEDEDFIDYLHNSVCQNGATAEKAVSQTEQYFSHLFRDTQDEYMIARIDDIRDICGQLTAFLSAENFSDIPQSEFVLVADELLPGDLMRFNSENLMGIIIGSGSVFSHVSILIKELGIPAIICRNTDCIETGMTVLLNGDSSTACIEPDKTAVENFDRLRQLTDKQNNFSPFDNLPCAVYVNIGNPKEVTNELFEKCDGIGLFRTEYLYFGRPDLPDEEEQFSVYREILEKADGKNVTVRTFDIGSDKTAEALPLEKEENPALGFRGLRVYSLYPEAFKAQIRALLRAAVYGNLRIMFPMVNSCREIDEIRQIISETAQELSEQNIPYKLPLQGAMIETPAAAILSDEIAENVDFLSVGTNDLTQYTLAVDRQNGHLDSFCDSSHKAVISLIKTASENAHKNGIEIGICGELASSPERIETWGEIGIDYLSVSPSVLK